MRSIVRYDAPQSRDPRRCGCTMDPGSAAHRHSASKTRVNALVALRSIRGTHSSSLRCARFARASKDHGPWPILRDAPFGAGPESVFAVVVMDTELVRSLSSGGALRGPVGTPRNDERMNFLVIESPRVARMRTR